MTLPNRDGYLPGETRAAAQRKMVHGAEEEASGMVTVSNVAPASDGVSALRPGLWSMLAGAISPVQSKSEMKRASEFSITSPVSDPESVAHRRALALAARRRLEQDPFFEDAWGSISMRGLMVDGSAAAASAAAGVGDSFEIVLEQLPRIAIDRAGLVADAKHSGLGTCLDGVLVDGDSSLRATFERVAQQICEWTKRRLALDDSTMEQIPEPPRSTSPTEMLREGVTPEALGRESMGRWEDASSSPSMTPTLAAYGFDLSARGGAPKRRANLNKTAKELLRVWFETHIHHPYPTEEEKEWLACQGGITLEQVNNWFINTRGRKWKPMLKRLMAEKQKGECKLLDDMVQRMTEPYHREV